MATVVTDVGEQQIVDRIDGLGTQPDWIGSGTGVAAAAETDTALGTEVETRDQGTVTQPSADTFRCVATHAYGATFAITEAGLFDASTGSNMYVRGDFAAINVVNGDSIEFTIDIQIT